jgi:hypothetical protein
MRRREENIEASFSKATATFSNVTVCTLLKAMINKLINLILAKFNSEPKILTKVSFKMLILLSYLVFMY